MFKMMNMQHWNWFSSCHSLKYFLIYCQNWGSEYPEINLKKHCDLSQKEGYFKNKIPDHPAYN
jgi:hypothetical protein